MKLSTAKRRAWQACSEYVRRRYAMPDGWVRCVTCGCMKHWKDMHAGHFIPKKRGMAVYFHAPEEGPSNIHAQCPQCNVFNGGMLIEYTQFIDEEYGEGSVEKLLELSRTTVRMRTQDFLDIEAEYKQKLKVLE